MLAECLRALPPPTEVEAKKGPKPDETRVLPVPKVTRAARGPTDVRTPRVDTRTLKPGGPTRKPKLISPCLHEAIAFTKRTRTT